MQVNARNDRPAPAGKIVAALDSGPGAAKVAEVARELAAALHGDWEAIHIETPANTGSAQEQAAEALGPLRAWGQMSRGCRQ